VAHALQRNEELPPPVRTHLPASGQDACREAFNHAADEYFGDVPVIDVAP
jgi:cation transport regulator ChaB